MKKIIIEWKHFDKQGKTCDRCSQTRLNLKEVIRQLKKEYLKEGIQIEFQETKLSESRMAESNQILIDGEFIENLLPNSKAGKNYCGSCSDLINDPKGCHCRTIVKENNIYEAIPIDLIKQAISNKLGIDVDYKFTDKKSMKIQVLGSGCATCKKLYEITQKAVNDLGLKEKVEYITDVSKIIEMGVMQSPVLAINGSPVMTGFTPNVEKIKKIITTSLKTEETPSKCGCGGDCC